MAQRGISSSMDIYDKCAENLVPAVSRIHIESGMSRTMTPGHKITNDKQIVTYHRENETGNLIETATSPNQNHVTARSLNTVSDLRQSFSNLGRAGNGGNLRALPLKVIRPNYHENWQATFHGQEAHPFSSSQLGRSLLPGTDDVCLLRVSERSSGDPRGSSSFKLSSFQNVGNSAFNIRLTKIPTVVWRPYSYESTPMFDKSGRASSFQGVCTTKESSPKFTRTRPVQAGIGATSKSSTSSSPRLKKRATSVQSFLSAESSRDGRTSPRLKFTYKHMNKEPKGKKIKSEKRERAKIGKSIKKSQSHGDIAPKGSTDQNVYPSIIVNDPGRCFMSGDELIFDNSKYKKDWQMVGNRDVGKLNENLRSSSVELPTLQTGNIPQAFIERPRRSTSIPDLNVAQSNEMLYLGQDGQVYANAGAELYPYDHRYMYYPAIDPDFCNNHSFGGSLHRIDLETSGSDEYSSWGEGFTGSAEWQKAHVTSKKKLKCRRLTRDDTDLHTRSRARKKSSYVTRRCRSISPSFPSEGRRRSSKYSRLYPQETSRKIDQPVSPQENSDESPLDDEYLTSDYSGAGGKAVRKAQLRQRRSNDRFNSDISNILSNEESRRYVPQPHQPSFISCPLPNRSGNVLIKPEADVTHRNAQQHNAFIGFPVSETSGPLDKLLRNTHLHLASMRTYLDAMSSSLANIPVSTLSSLPQNLQQSDTLDHVETQEFFKARQHDQIVAPENTVVSVVNTDGGNQERPTTMHQTQIYSQGFDTVIEDCLGDPVLSDSFVKKFPSQPTAITHTNCLDQHTNRGTKNLVNILTPENPVETARESSDIVDTGALVRTFVWHPTTQSVHLANQPENSFMHSTQATAIPTTCLTGENWILKHTRSSAVQTEPEKTRAADFPPPPTSPPPLPQLPPLTRTKSAQTSLKERQMTSSTLAESLPYAEELQSRISSKELERQISNQVSPPPVLPKPKWVVEKLHSQKSLSPTSPTDMLKESTRFDVPKSENAGSLQASLESSLDTHNLPSLIKQTQATDVADAERPGRRSINRSCSVRERVEEFRNLSEQKKQNFTPEAKKYPPLKLGDVIRDKVYPPRPLPLTDSRHSVVEAHDNTQSTSHHPVRNSNCMVQGFDYISKNDKDLLPLDYDYAEFMPPINVDVSDTRPTSKKFIFVESESRTAPAAQSSPMLNSLSDLVSPIDKGEAAEPERPCSVPSLSSPSSTRTHELEKSYLVDNPRYTRPLLRRPDEPDKHEVFTKEESPQTPTTPTSPFGGVKLPGFPALPPPVKSGIPLPTNPAVPRPYFKSGTSQSAISVTPNSFNVHTPLALLDDGTHNRTHQTLDNTPYRVYQGDPDLLKALTKEKKSKSLERFFPRSAKRKKSKASKGDRAFPKECEHAFPFVQKTLSRQTSMLSVYEFTESGFTLYKGSVALDELQKSKKDSKSKKTSRVLPITGYPRPKHPPIISPISPIARPSIVFPGKTDTESFYVTNGFNKATPCSHPNGISHTHSLDRNLCKSLSETVMSPQQVGTNIDLQRIDFSVHSTDINSEEDGSEYMYTSQGWSQMLSSLPDQNAAIFFCDRVEDKTTQYWAGVFKNTHSDETSKPPTKSIEGFKFRNSCEFSKTLKFEENGIFLEEFFDYCIPQYKSRDGWLPSNVPFPDSKARNSVTLLDPKGLGEFVKSGLGFQSSFSKQCQSRDQYLGSTAAFEKKENSNIIIFNYRDCEPFDESSLSQAKLDISNKMQHVRGTKVFWFRRKINSGDSHFRTHKLVKQDPHLFGALNQWRNFKTLRNGIVRAQAQFRMFSQRRRYIKTREHLKHRLEEHRLQRRKQEVQAKMEKERRPCPTIILASLLFELQLTELSTRGFLSLRMLSRARCQPAGRMIQKRISQLLVDSVPPDYDAELNVEMDEGGAEVGKRCEEEDDDKDEDVEGNIVEEDAGCRNKNTFYRVGFFWYGRPLPILGHGGERQAQMMANIANLEIPGELALVYNKLDDWDLYHSGPTVITAVGDVSPMDMGYKLPVDINSHVFSKYTSVYFKNPNWGMQMEAIETSLTPVQGEENNALALAVFKLIMRYMCDKQLNEKTEKVLADFIVQMGLKNEGLRDEILCQIVNQTWQDQNIVRAERGWQLMAACLCCFNPSPTLFKYLLKYVSDVGVQGYKFLCQHKVLQSAYMDPLMSRVYPPTLLEWRAIERKANMALDVKFPDGGNMIGHVESWTSGELFASHLLKLRGLKENSQGWTLQLQEDVDQYELMGYDYVLDLVGETEVPPGFPAGLANFLVSVNRERAQHKRRTHVDGPHNPEKERALQMLGPLPEMIKRDIPIATSSASAVNKDSEEDELGFSTTSVLNQRPTEILPLGLSERSVMNTRYTKRSRAPAPPVMNGHVPNGIANGHITTITEDEEEGFTSVDVSNLSNTRINGRYFANGDAAVQKDLSNSKMNLRYNKKGGRGVSGQINRRQNQQNPNSHRDDGTHSDNTDWSHLVEDIFNNALEKHIEQDGRVLGGRIKGGGKGVPGFQQPATQPPTTLNIGLANGAVGAQPPLLSPLMGAHAPLPNLGLVGN
ncbi:myosin-XV, partial [Elysia marginata]